MDVRDPDTVLPSPDESGPPYQGSFWLSIGPERLPSQLSISTAFNGKQDTDAHHTRQGDACFKDLTKSCAALEFLALRGHNPFTLADLTGIGVEQFAKFHRIQLDGALLCPQISGIWKEDRQKDFHCRYGEQEAGEMEHSAGVPT